jgi:hypothetical protein
VRQQKEAFPILHGGSLGVAEGKCQRKSVCALVSSVKDHPEKQLHPARGKVD